MNRIFTVETTAGRETVSAAVVNGTGYGILSAHTDELADYLQGTPFQIVGCVTGVPVLGMAAIEGMDDMLAFGEQP